MTIINNNYLNSIADLISLTPLLIILNHFFNIIIQLFTNQYADYKIFLGLMLSMCSSELLKCIPYPSTFHKYTMRPKDAQNCDFFSLSGNLYKNLPGFPSTHMSITSFFVTYNILSSENTDIYTLNNISLITLLILMGWSRIHKKCHNLIQVIGGSLYGGFLGYCFKIIIL